MKAKEHIKCFCFFWKPTVARRITLYFLLFGVIIFFVTSMLFTIAGKKEFMNTTSKVINHQLAQLGNSKEPDFIWQGINQSLPELHRLLEILANLSSAFYTVKDISIYSKTAQGSAWYRLYFPEGPTLMFELVVEDSYTRKLDRWLGHRFRPAMAKIMSADGTHAMFVNITGPKDANHYFLKIGVDSEGMTGFMHKQIKHLILFFLVALILLRFLGYYFARKIAGPIENLSEISTDVAKGDLSKTAPVTSNDEIGELAKNFNHMIEGLREWERIKMIEFEMEKGQKIQRDFLPGTIPHLPDWNIATCFFPAGKVSGDFYDVFKLSDGSIGLVIADVCDKGVGSALYMALFRSLIRVFAEQAAYCDAPAIRQLNQPWDKNTPALSAEDKQKIRLRAVPFTNNYIAQTHGDEGMFATLFFGVLNPETGILYYINGGHEPLYLVNSEGVKQKIDPTGPAVGLWPDTTYDMGQIRMEPGDMLLGYTDGVTEARSPADELFTRGRLRSLIEQPFTTASELLERIKANLFSFIDIAPRHDDVTMLAVQRVVNAG
ncbi:MAG: SpoIIE family protein phosphatase [Desulfobacterales bacterium]|nr:MAG: SpoIIE family protein phosphatase [Desulfobacterales bacterium]